MAVDVGQETIVAIATPEGSGALGVVRLSGSDAFAIGSVLFSKPERLLDAQAKEAIVSNLYDSDNSLIDHAVTIPWRNPHSYTGQDLVEFVCHGGREVLRRLFRRLIELGARSAEPGEFTQRAFLNGKMTLDQAEAVGALIEARTEAAARAAATVYRGGLRKAGEHIRSDLLDLLSRVELSLDFIEEELEVETAEVTLGRLDTLRSEIEALHDQYEVGKLLRHGATVAIAGSPNSGKSTLLNRLVGFERAIVSDIPGTTRDYIDTTLNWSGLPVRLVDTAGLRNTSDSIEALGAERSLDLMRSADIVVWLHSAQNSDFSSIQLNSIRVAVPVLNMIDLVDSEKRAVALGDLGASTGLQPLSISGLSGEGVDDLRNKIVSLLMGSYDPSEIIVLEERHAQILSLSLEALARARESMGAELGFEFVAADLRVTLNLIGEITGAVSSGDLLNQIFARFCVGK